MSPLYLFSLCGALKLLINCDKYAKKQKIVMRISNAPMQERDFIVIEGISVFNGTGYTL